MRARFTIHLDAFGRITREIAAPLVEAGARIVREEVVSAMEDAPPRTGREYLVPGTKTAYTASAPGEPPAIREGTYRDSWKETPAVEVGDTVVAAAYTDLRTEDGAHLIGEILEFGSGRIAPRPHVRPAIDAAAARIRELVEQVSG